VEIPSGKGETVTVNLDGRSYEIDLTAKNASGLRKALRPYIEAGRPIKNSPDLGHVSAQVGGPVAASSSAMFGVISGLDTRSGAVVPHRARVAT
jgi:nucleoid-associated protein Lsr2